MISAGAPGKGRAAENRRSAHCSAKPGPGRVSRAVEHCLRRPGAADGAIFNLGTGHEHTIRETVALVEEIHGGPLPVTWGAVERGRWDSPRWVADTRRQTGELGFTAQTNFRDGLRATYRWFAENAHRYEEYEQR